MSQVVALGLRALGPCSKRAFTWCFLPAILGLAAVSQSLAADVVRVEEDWALVIGKPDPDTNAPQVTCVFSPIGDVETAYAAFDINHHSQPGYAAGGLQLQVWSNNVPLLSDNDPDGEVLSTEGETITWTQQMALNEGQLTVAITNGKSSTWGAFGGNGKLQATVAASLSNLNAYTPDVSVANSGIGFAANRVQSLQLTCIRYYMSDGRVYQDNNVRRVYSHD